MTSPSSIGKQKQVSHFQSSNKGTKLCLILQNEPVPEAPQTVSCNQVLLREALLCQRLASIQWNLGCKICSSP